MSTRRAQQNTPKVSHIVVVLGVVLGALATLALPSLTEAAPKDWNATDWTSYDTITIDATIVDEDLIDFPVYVDLANLSSAFWGTTPSGSTTVATDIRVTTLGGTELPRELVFASSTLETGELHFKADTISATTDTSFRIWYNGTTTGDYATTSTYGAQNVWTNAYAAVFHLQEDGNNNTDGYRDSTSNNNHASGTSMTTDSDVEGHLGKAQDFDGASDFLSFKQNNLPFGTASRTLSAWLTPDSVSGTEQPLGYGDTGGFNTTEYFQRSGSQWNYGSYNSNEYASAANSAYAGQATFLVGTDGPNQIANIYVDGVIRDREVGSRSINSGLALIGSGPYSSSQEWDGQVDEVRIASTTRSAAWIKAEHENQSLGQTFYTVTTNDLLRTAENQYFVTDQAAAAISPITIVETSSPTITTANDIRITIDPAVAMEWDTTDTTATITGSSSAKVSGTVSYEDSGATLIIDVTSNFASGDTITIAGLSFTNFTSVNTATTALSIHTDGDVDASPADTDDKTVTIESAYNATDWTLYDTITIDADVIDEDLTDFPIYVDLNDLTDTFWATTPAAASLTGTDIRVTTLGGTELPRELVFASSTLETGELHFKADTISATTDTSFRIWYNGTTTGDYHRASTYGTENVWTNDYALVMHMEGEATTTVDAILDSTTNRNHGTGVLIDSTNNVAGHLGGSYNFNGSNEYLNFQQNNLPFGTASRTLSAWITPDTVSGTDQPLGYGGYVAYSDAEYFQRSGAQWNYGSYNSNEYAQSANSAYAGVSTFLVGTDGPNQIANIYVDGIIRDSEAGTRDIAEGGVARIGSGPYSSSQEWDGQVDEVRIASTTRSAAWIKAEHENQSLGQTFYTVTTNDLLRTAENQYFVTDQAAAAISPITIVETSSPTITTANDIRITIDPAVAMEWDTTDTTATITGSSSAKVSGTVSYEDSGATLIIDVTSNFASGDTITIAGLSFTNFTSVNTATTALSIHTDGDVDASPADTDDKTVTIESAYNATDWTLYDTITIDADVIDEDLTDFPIYVDLNDLTDTFWATTPAAASLTGTDIRVTTLGGTELPRELVFASSTLETGELHFKADTISATTDTSFRIWYNGTTTGDYHRASTYGTENVWTNDYALVMHMEGEATTTVDAILDSTTNRNHGTGVLIDSTNNVAGHLGGSYNFNGSNEYLNFQQNNLPFGTASRTLSAWITPDTVSGTDQPLGYGGYVAYSDAEYFQRSGAQWNYGSYNSNEYAQSANSAYAGVSTFLVGTDGPNQIANIYVDGIIRDSEAGTRDIAEGGVARIGSGPYSSSQEWDGQVDEVRIASTTRSAAWIKAEHENQSLGQTFYTVTTNDLLRTAENQYFVTDQAAAAISPITIVETSSPTITTANDIRITIDPAVAMEWDTTDTTATITGSSSAKVSGTVSYEDSGATLIIDVTSNFASGDTITIAGLSFTNFTSVNTATTALSIHTDGDVDASPADTDDKTVTIESAYNATDWTLYDTITIDADVIDEDLTDFPIYVDLNDLTDTFWATTPAAASLTGTDIRVTTLGGTELPRELVFASSTLETGELHFKADTISATTDTSFRIWYNGTTTGDYHRASTYGTENVWTNDYALVMHMEGEATTTVDAILDSTTNRNHGTGVLIDSTNNVAGHLGGSYNFNGSNEYLNFQQNNLPFGTASRTLSAWITPDTVSGTDQPLGYGGYVAYSDAEYFQRSGAQWNYGSYNSNEYAQSANSAYAGVSTFLVGTDGPNQIANIYVDGVFRDSEVGTRDIAEGGVARIGSGPYSSSQEWDGQVDEVRIASTTRSAAWIKAEHLNQATTTDFYTVPATTVPTISSDANQTFYYSDSNVSMSEITVTDSVDTAEITAANDIRIAIATSSVNMRWTTSDTEAVIGGNVSAKVSSTVSYSGDGSVLVLDVTSDFVPGDQLFLSGVSFTSFLSANTATSALELHIDGVVDGTPNAVDDKTVTIINDGTKAWNATDWTTYDTITIDADVVDEDLTDFPVYVDLADLSSTFWATTPSGSSVTGTDIRVTDEANFELARELVVASSTLQTGELWFKAGTISSTTDTTFRIWYNGTTTGDYASTTQTGSQNVWTNNFELVYHMGEDPSADDIVDSTSNNYSGTTVGTLSASDLVSGQLGSALSFNANWYIDNPDIAFGSSEDYTLSAWQLDDTNDNVDTIFGANGDYALGGQTSGNGVFYQDIGFSGNNGPDKPTEGLWHQIALTRNGGSQFYWILNGGASTTALNASNAVTHDAIASTQDGGGSPTAGFGGDLDEIRFASVSRSEAWMKAEYFNQNGDGEFYTANAGAADNVKTWNATDWTQFDSITIDAANIDDDLTDFPVYVDLADLSGTFWSTTVDGGTDIRVTTGSTSPTELPREVVSASTTAQTGELWFKADSISSTTDTTFRIYYNGTTTNDYARADTYGLENVWTSGFELVYHMGQNPTSSPEQIIDSTSYRRDGTTFGSSDESDLVSGQLGSALSFNANWYIDNPDIAFGSSEDYTLSAWQLDDTNDNVDTIFGANGDYALGGQTSGNGVFYQDIGFSGNNGPDKPTEGLWHQIALTRNGGSQFYWILNGGASTTALNASNAVTHDAIASTQDGGGSPTAGFGGDLDEIRFASVSRSEAWMKAEYFNQNGDGEFYTANAGAADNVKTWNATDWTQFDSITIDAANIDDDLTDFPVYVDLADLSGTFWSTTVDGGTDIRVTTGSTSPTELPREVVSASTTAQTGELWFKADSISSTTDTTFRIYYNGTTTNDYARADTYGLENVWTSGFELVYHMGQNPTSSPEQIIDSTSYRRDGTTFGSSDESDLVSGQLGSALSFNANWYIDNPDIAFGSSEDYTLSAWQLDDTNDNVDTIFGANGDYALGGQTSGNGVFYQDIGFSGNNGPDKPTEGLWHQIALTRNGGSQFYWILNGGASTTALNASNAVTHDAIASTQDGGGSPTAGFGGDLDEIRFASVSRSEAWMKAEYTNQGGSEFYTVASAGPEPVISSQANQTFSFSDDTVAISPITIYDATDTAEITAANDIRIAIATSSVDMRFDTTDTTATISGTASGKVSGTVSYAGDGSVLVLNVTSDFAASESITVSDLSFTSFNASNTATSALQLHIDGGVDGSPAATDDKTVTIIASAKSWNATDWTLFDTITIDAANIDEDLTDFPVYVDLADLSATFWATTPSASSTVGTDIRVTTNSDVELPRELVAASSTAQTGELHFKADSISSTTDTVFKLWYNGSTNGDYATTSTYGAQAVWSNGFVGVYHLDDDPSVGAVPTKDSTAEGNDGVSNGSMTAGDVVSGKIGEGYDFDGSDDYLNVEPTSPLLNTASNTVSGWIYIDTLSRGIFETATDNTTQDSTPYYLINTNGTDLRSYEEFAKYDVFDTVATGRWHHFTTVRTATSELGYLDGVETINRIIGSSGDNDEFHVGVGFSGYFDGQIDLVKISTTTRSAAWVSAEYTNQSTTTDFYTAAAYIPPVAGTSTLANHDDTQVNNNFNFQNKTQEALFAFKLTPETRTATVTNTVINVSGAGNIATTSFSNIFLYRDNDNDAEYDAGDTQIATGTFTLAGGAGTITFPEDYAATTSLSLNYVVIADWDAPERGEGMKLTMTTDDLTITDSVGTQTVFGSVDSVHHLRNNQGGGSNGLGDEGVPGNGIVTGGTNDGGEEVGGEPNFNPPTGSGDPHNEWTGGSNAFASDGVYASETTGGERQSFDTFGYSVPGSNTINGIAVKLEASAVSGTGTIEVALSWDGGTSVTAVKETNELTNTDAVYTLGGSSDTWGRSWSASEFSDANFRVRLIGQPDSNTIQVDAITVRVYHSTGGGGSGGGGGEI